MVTLYQRFISPLTHFLGRTLFGPHFACRFSPTCSQYARQAIGKYGIISGAKLAFFRVIRCHPLSPGGHDPVK